VESLSSQVEVKTAESGAGNPRPSRRFTVISLWALIGLAILVYAPVLGYMVHQWSWDGDYSHGFLIVPLAAWFAWERGPKLRRVEFSGSWLGLIPLAMGTLTLLIGRLGIELMNMRISFVFTLIGLVLLLLGWRAFRVLAFPLLFLFLMVPLPRSVVNIVAFPLQLIATDFAVNVLYLLEIPALREGNIIHLANTQLFVAEACSGLRSLTALITLGVIFAYFFRKSTAERIIIVLSAIPIAILVNAFRVALTGGLTHYLGQEAASGWIHQTEGLFTFGIAFLLLLLEAWLLSLLWPKTWRGSKKRRTAA
jgi:exosortase